MSIQYDEHATESDQSAETAPAGRPRWRPRRPARRTQFLAGGLFLLGFLALTVAYVPRMLAKTSMRHGWVADALPGFEGRAEVESMDVGWFTPIELHGLALYEPDGRPMLTAERLKLSYGIWALLVSGTEEEVYEIERPVVHVRVRPGTSNIDEYLIPALSGGEGGTPLRLTCIDGELRVYKQNNAVALNAAIETPEVVAEGVSVELAMGQPGTAIDRVAFQASVTSAAGRPGSLTGKVEWPNGTNGSAAASGAAQISLQGIHAAALDPALLRWTQLDLDLDGPVTGELTCRIEQQSQLKGGQLKGGQLKGVQLKVTIESKLQGENLRLRAPAWLGPQAIELGNTNLVCAAVMNGGDLEISQASLTSAAGNLSASGQIDWQRLAAYPWPRDAAGWYALAAAPPQADGIHALQLRGEIDLAHIGRQSPEVLALREGVDLQSGTIELLVAIGQQEGAGSVLERSARSRIGATSLVATAGGKRITWERPVQINLDATQTARGIEVQNLRFTSDVGQLEASGRVGQARIEGRFDLDRLVEQAGQFVDLGRLQLAGQVTGAFDLQRESARQNQPQTGGADLLRASGELQFTNLTAELGDWGTFSEPRTTVTLAAAAGVEGTRLVSMQSLEAEVIAGGDDLDLTLRTPVAINTPAHQWPWSIALRGRLSQWQQRIPAAYLPNGWTIDGNALVLGDVAFAPQGVQFENLQITATDFALDGPQLRLREPRLDLRGSGRWSADSGQLSLSKSQLQSSTLAMATEGLELNTKSGQARGAVGVRGDLERLRSCFPAESAVGRFWADFPTRGELVGDVSLSEAVGQTRCQWNLEITQFALLEPLAPPQATSGQFTTVAAPNAATMETRFAQPKLTWTGTARYDGRGKTLQLDQSQIESELARVDFAGALDLKTSPPGVNIAGKLHYNLEKLSAAAGMGGRLDIRGTGVEPFWIKVDTRQSATGAVASVTTGEAALSWSQGAWSGLAIGPGRAKIELSADALTMPPFETTLSEGRLRLGARMPLYAHSPLHVEITPGRVLENVRLSPEACRGWFMYFSPLVAGATQAEGRLSLQLDRATVPLADPARADLLGTLSIAQGQVRPGQMTMQLVTLARQIEAIMKRRPFDAISSNDLALNLPSQNVRFRMAEERIWHEPMQVTVGDVVLRTRGSVGFDNTLDLVAEVPIQAQWVENDRFARSLTGQIVQIPVKGTVSQPRIDNRALQQLAAQMATGAATQIFSSELQRQLDRLLPQGGR